MAGLTTCLWQGFPEFNNMKIIDALRRSGSIAAAPNDRIGYGIPDMKKAFTILLKDFSTANAAAGTCKTTISWKSKDVSTMKYEIERRAPGEAGYTKVGERFGTGNALAIQNYQYADSLINVQAGSISYRIRQIIDTAASGFSADYIDTVSVNLAASCVTTAVIPVSNGENSFTVAPNPARENITIRLTTTAAIPNLVIRIIDGKGQLLSSVRKSKQSGASSFELSLFSLPKGKYYVSVFDNEKLLGTREILKL
jgi:hypothetical protein